MKLTFFGGAGGNVIPSRILLGSTLLDCGDAIPTKGESSNRNNLAPLNPAEIQKVLLSHGHTDHVGALCALVQGGFKGNIESTRGTKEITEALLRDNYNENSVNAVFKQYSNPIDFLKRFEIEEGVYATFYPAQGHILGASSILLEFEKENLRVLYSGDLGNTNKNMLEVNGEVPEADIVIMESTYGYREHHPDFGESLNELYDEINTTYEQHGNFFVPVLSIHKLQEGLYYQNLGIERGKIPEDINIFVDSTLGEVITDIYKLLHHRELFSAEAKDYFNNFSKVYPYNYSDYIRASGRNIVDASSGLDGLRGRFRKYFQELRDGKNSVMVGSHRIKGSPLDQIAEGKERFGANGSSIPLNAKSFTLSGFSSHADATQLVTWLGKTKAKYVFLFHGENDARGNLKEMIATNGLCSRERIFTPDLLEEFDLTNLPRARDMGSVPAVIKNGALQTKEKTETMTLLGRIIEVPKGFPHKESAD